MRKTYINARYVTYIPVQLNLKLPKPQVHIHRWLRWPNSFRNNFVMDLWNNFTFCFLNFWGKIKVMINLKTTFWSLKLQYIKDKYKTYLNSQNFASKGALPKNKKTGKAIRSCSYVAAHQLDGKCVFAEKKTSWKKEKRKDLTMMENKHWTAANSKGVGGIIHL